MSFSALQSRGGDGFSPSSRARSLGLWSAAMRFAQSPFAEAATLPRSSAKQKLKI
jgi:hypothetical protein